MEVRNGEELALVNPVNELVILMKETDHAEYAVS